MEDVWRLVFTVVEFLQLQLQLLLLLLWRHLVAVNNTVFVVVGERWRLLMMMLMKGRNVRVLGALVVVVCWLTSLAVRVGIVYA